MLLKAGAVSLALLLLSRLLGLVRESAQAAAFGTTGLADVAVLMLTLPDWITGVLASGALAYVLLPHWAQQAPALHADTQRRVARGLLLSGVVAGVLLCLLRGPIVGVFVGGLPVSLRASAALAIAWSGAALPAALLAALWMTRLQYQRDFTGLYASNLVVNGVLIAALYYVAGPSASIDTVVSLGLGLMLAMGLRLLWLQHRLRAFVFVGAQQANALPLSLPLPRGSLWAWAALAAGLPLTLPFVARSFASGGGEGALATFNYAWKLVELPLVLAIQLAATLTFPAITRAMTVEDKGAVAPLALHDAAAAGPSALLPLPAQAMQAIHSAFMLTWTLACAAVAGLQVGAPAIASLLFGWGRMHADGLAAVATWGRIGSWSLLPQALIAVALSILAVQGRMRVAVAAYGVALAALLALGSFARGNGVWLMSVLDAVLAGVALVVLNLLRGPHVVASLLPWRAIATPTAVLLAFCFATRGIEAWLYAPTGPLVLVFSVLSAAAVMAISLLTSAELRGALRR